MAVLEFSDFQCPFCGVFARDTWPELNEQYVRTGKVQFAFRHLPLGIHEHAEAAAVAAECAGREGKFWEMHDRLFSGQKNLGDGGLDDSAKSLGLTKAKFDECRGGDAVAKVKSDAALARSLGVTGTPTFFVGVVQEDGRVKILQRIVGAASIQQFSTAIASAIAKAK